MSVASLQAGDELRDLYRELILDHSRNPRNFGKLADATHVAEGINPLCGDKLRLYLRIDSDRVTSATFEGSGCAISIASASLLTEILTGVDRATAMEYCQAIVAHLDGKQPAGIDQPELRKLRALDGVREFPTRVKCATLAWEALNSAIAGRSAPATTE
jgi:nitrogen fixation NifU-like protein